MVLSTPAALLTQPCLDSPHPSPLLSGPGGGWQALTTLSTPVTLLCNPLLQHLPSLRVHFFMSKPTPISHPSIKNSKGVRSSAAKSQLHCLLIYPSATGLRVAFSPSLNHAIATLYVALSLLNLCLTSTLVTSHLPQHHGCVSGLLTRTGYSQWSFESMTYYYTSCMLCNQILAT